MCKVSRAGRAIGLLLLIGAFSSNAQAWERAPSEVNCPSLGANEIAGQGHCNVLTPFPNADTGGSQYPYPAARLRSDSATKYGLDTHTADGILQPGAREASAHVQPVTVGEARNALNQVESLFAQGKQSDALLWLRVAEQALPRLADRFALKRAQILMRMQRPTEACQAFQIALESPKRDIAVQARIGQVRCALAAGDRKGEVLFAKLVKQYPNLPMASDLVLDRARARQGWGERASAIALYQHLDLSYPGTAAAVQARAELEKARSEGLRVRPYTFKERVVRAERLASYGATAMARDAVKGLIGVRGLDEELRTRLQLLAYRLFGSEIPRADESPTTATPASDATKLSAGDLVPIREMPPDPIAEERVRKIALFRIRQIQGDKPIRRLDFTQLNTVLDIAVDKGLRDTADEVITAMAARSRSSPKARFSAAMLATGVAADERVAALLRTLIGVGAYRASAPYHYARALERAGQLSEAERFYQTVLDGETDRTSYYAIWTEQRLVELANQRQLRCAPESASVVDKGPLRGSNASDKSDTATTGLLASALRIIGAPPLARASATKISGAIDVHSARNKAESEKLAKQVIEKLSPFIERHGEAYPWFSRAVDLIELGEYTDAADELYDAYLAWRDVSGFPRLRAGLETMFIGSPPPRRSVKQALSRARMALTRAEREVLSELAFSLGDMGLAFRLAGWNKIGWPRPYEAKVEKAARKYGIDPNLLYAVMRAESLYDHRIVSSAGAIGLMQIMPRTGRYIADNISISDFEAEDLFNPDTALEFAAQHLAELVEGFQGRTALAIAAYNAGAHNVRRWMRRTRGDAPLDVFLERIPYRETFYYVRRVLSYYAVYRAQQGLPMERIEIDLPQ
jgi:soluble lytic murein transglycosylase